jgi:hypothetical protein
MANWYGHARTNYFRVKDVDKFCEWAKALGVLETETDAGRVALLSADEYGGWPTSIFNEETEEYEDIDIFQQVADHLEEGSVAVFMEVGAEKLRYLTGYAIAVNHKGDIVKVTLDDIYWLAQPLGTEITVAEY